MSDLEVVIVSSEDLKANVQNWFKFVPMSTDWRILIELLSDDPRIKPLASIIDVDKQMIRGTEMGKVVHFARQRDSRVREKWEITDEDRRHVWAVHKITKDEVKAPKKALHASLRTHSGVRTIGIDRTHDYVVMKRFDGDDVLWEDSPSFDPTSRETEFRRRKCHLGLVRRPDLASPGVSLLAFSASRPFIPSKMLWCVKYDDTPGRAILSLWFNSTPSFLAMLEERAETRGSFSGWGKYIWKTVLTLDPQALPKDHRELLLNTYEQIRDVPFPSLLDQFQTSFNGRMIIDKAVFQVLGFKEYLEDENLKLLYQSVHDELRRLKKIVEQG